MAIDSEQFLPDSTFLLIDGHALIYRAYHAFPELTTRSGQLVNAVYGFTRILLTSLRDFEPEYVAVAFDTHAPTLRAKQYEEYKANREAMPDDLRHQIDLVKDVVEALNIPKFELAGFEADDLIGTLTTQSEQSARDQVGKSVLNVVVTGDKDLFQLVTDQTHVFIPARGQRGVDTEYEPAGVLSKMGVTPAQIIELKALMGDSSDNIPGVKGIGQKTAVKLLSAYPSLEAVYAQVEKVANGVKDPAGVIKGSVFKKLQKDKDQAYLSRDLATIIKDVPIKLDLPACKLSGYNKLDAEKLFEDFEFDSLKTLLPADDFELGVQDALW